MHLASASGWSSWVIIWVRSKTFESWQACLLNMIVWCNIYNTEYAVECSVYHLYFVNVKTQSQCMNFRCLAVCCWKQSFHSFILSSLLCWTPNPFIAIDQEGKKIGPQWSGTLTLSLRCIKDVLPVNRSLSTESQLLQVLNGTMQLMVQGDFMTVVQMFITVFNDFFPSY